ncbi:unnamed protein product [Symbiodinium sp. CCMP2592]|nr:unnamed protein product [Symbiodinium sp. CCMP2592]
MAQGSGKVCLSFAKILYFHSSRAMLFRFLLVLMGLCSALRHVQVTDDAGAANESQKWGWLAEKFHPHAELGFARCMCQKDISTYEHEQKEYFGGYDRMQKCEAACPKLGWVCYCELDGPSFLQHSRNDYDEEW